MFLDVNDILGEEEGVKNLYFTFNCTLSVSYTIEVRAIDPRATMPTPISSNTPTIGSFHTNSKELFYSYKVYGAS